MLKSHDRLKRRERRRFKRKRPRRSDFYKKSGCARASHRCVRVCFLQAPRFRSPCAHSDSKRTYAFTRAYFAVSQDFADICRPDCRQRGFFPCVVRSASPTCSDCPICGFCALISRRKRGAQSYARTRNAPFCRSCRSNPRFLYPQIHRNLYARYSRRIRQPRGPRQNIRWTQY